MLTGILWLFLSTAYQDAILSEPMDPHPVGELFAEAVQKYNSVKRPESEALFRQVWDSFNEGGDIGEDEHLIITETLKYLGSLTFPAETATWYEALVRYDPSYELDSKDIPPKISSVFTDLKAKLVGRIRVSAVDAATGLLVEDATLLVDGKELGPIFREAVYSVLVGTHLIEIRKPNFDPSIAEIEIQTEQESSYSGVLTRNAAGVVLVVSPPEVKVTLNGQDLGPANEPVPTGYNQALAERNLTTDQVGAKFINNLQPGDYSLTFEMPCYKTAYKQLTISELKKITTLPFTMEPAGAFVTVKTAGDTEGGLLFLDQQRIGFLPVKAHRICPGEYELKVSFTDGEFIKKVIIQDGDHQEITAEPLPSIAWLGLQESEDGKPPTDLDAGLQALKSWNIRTVDPHDTELVPVNPFPILFESQEMTELGEADLTRNLNADLFMAARIVRRKTVIRYLEVAFWTPLSKKIDIKQFDFREIGKFEDLLKEMDRFPALTRPWLGIQTARLRELPGCKIIEVSPFGPMAQKAQPGSFVQSVNGAVLRNPGELMNLNQNQELTLNIDGAEVEVKPIPTIAEVPFNANASAPQALLARFEKLAKYHPDPLIRKSALFNQARYQFLLGDITRAFDIFASLQLDFRYGINRGSLFYYQGLCFRQLKDMTEASRAFRAVLDHPNATLFDAYGPKAAFWAEAALGSPDL